MSLSLNDTVGIVYHVLICIFYLDTFSAEQIAIDQFKSDL